MTVLLCLSACGRRANLPNLGSFLAGGQTAVLGEWPWAVIVYAIGLNGNPQYRFLDTGILINSSWVLTNANTAQGWRFDSL